MAAASSVSSKLGGQLPSRITEGQGLSCSLQRGCANSLQQLSLHRSRRTPGNCRYGRGYARRLKPRKGVSASRQDDTNSSKGGGADSGSGPPSDEDHPPILKADWRTFRAQLVAHELLSEMSPSVSDAQSSIRIQGREWAHAIQEPEKGCLLLASTRLDRDDYFDRSVVLVLDHSEESTFGIVLNRPLPFTFSDVPSLPLQFKDCFKDERVHFGGPLRQGRIFAVTGEADVGFEEIVPGVFFGEPAACWRVADLISGGKAKASSFRFCSGYAGWGSGQLAHELRAGAWQLAACSADLITQPLSVELFEGKITSRSGIRLWEQIHELMGGEYAELSRKSRMERGGV